MSSYFEELAKAMPKEEITLVIKDANGVKEHKAEYSPLTGSVRIAGIVCSKRELGLWLKRFYNAELIEIK